MWVIDACHTSLESAVGAQYISMPAAGKSLEIVETHLGAYCKCEHLFAFYDVSINIHFSNK